MPLLPFPSLFSFSTSNTLSQRIDALRDAEANLLHYARTRFGPSTTTTSSTTSTSTPFTAATSNIEHDLNGVQLHDAHDESNHEFEIFDTPIPPPSVLLSFPQKWGLGGLGGLGGSSHCMKNIQTSKIASLCQVFHVDRSSGGEENDGSDENVNRLYRLHGVKVTNKRLLDPTQNQQRAANSQNDQNKQHKQPAPLVLLHGYANGSLYFYRNLMQLSHYHFSTIYALDMLGWGLSSRPTFPDFSNFPNVPNFELDSLHAHDDAMEDGSSKRSNRRLDDDDDHHSLRKEKNVEVSTAESFFVESLESWRRHHSLPKMTLAGHSMGGYLSVAYAEKYPQHVERLILLSPVGVPQRLEEDDANDERRLEMLPLYVRTMIRTARWLFDKGITPGSFLRSWPSSQSRRAVEGYVSNRLPAITCEGEQKALGEYLYHNSMLPGSGEYCLSKILTNGAFGRVPLVKRIPDLRCVGSKKSELSEVGEGMEVHFIYGENDWMDYRGGLEVQRLCANKRIEWEKMHKGKQQQTDIRDDGHCSPPPPPPKVFVHGVRNAGHLLMLDNYQEFNAAVIIAAGGEDKLPIDFPRPVEIVCSDVAMAMVNEASASNNNKRDANNNRKREVIDENEAAYFFRGSRFNRRSKKEKDEDGVKEDGVERDEDGYATSANSAKSDSSSRSDGSNSPTSPVGEHTRDFDWDEKDAYSEGEQLIEQQA